MDPVAKAFYNLNQNGKPHRWAKLDEFRKDIEALSSQLNSLDSTDPTSFDTRTQTFASVGLAQDKGRLADNSYPVDFFPNGLQLTLKKGETVYSKDTITLKSVKEIARNRVNNKLVTLNVKGEPLTQPLVVWCEQLNRDYNTVQLRLQRGWTQQRALSQPTNKPYRDKVQTPYRSKKAVTLPPCE